MNTRRLLFLTLLTLTASAFLYMIAKKTNTTGTQRISLEEFSQWQKKNGPEIVQLRNYIREQAPKMRSLTTYHLDKKIKKTVNQCQKNMIPTIDKIICKINED